MHEVSLRRTFRGYLPPRTPSLSLKHKSVQVKVKVTLRLTVSQSVSQSWCRASIWGSRPDIYCCLTVTALLLWGALPDERTGLSFVRVTVCISKSFVIM
jgi:hypothetical protein